MEGNGLDKDHSDLAKMWPEAHVAFEKVNSIFASVTMIANSLAHLEKLQKLEEIALNTRVTKESNARMEKGILDSAMGKEHIPLPIVNNIFKLLGMVIVGLLVVIVFLLTGENYGFIGQLHK